MKFIEWILEQFLVLPHFLQVSFLLVLFVVIWYLSYKLFDFILVAQGQRLVKKSKNKIDDILFEHKILHKLAHLPTYILLKCIFAAGLFKIETFKLSLQWVGIIFEIYGILIIIALLYTILDCFNRGRLKKKLENIIPLKACIQVMKIIIGLIAIILLFSKITGQSPQGVLVGMGALTAVILLIFKDAILGFVAGIQLATGQLVHEGDWVEMPKYGADGEVMDVALTTVKIRNWDKTITSLPTYSLISEGFKNWRGMSDSKMRRIKRSIYIDMSSVEFLDDAQMSRLEGLPILREYFEHKKQEIEEWNKFNNASNDPLVKRQLTNLGSFRKYLKYYLQNQDHISKEGTLIIRQLQSTPQGLPLEIYAFSNEYEWSDYEDIQSDIFDHALAVLTEFGLRVFQQPTGVDFQSLNNKS